MDDNQKHESMIDLHYSEWVARPYKATETLKAVTPFLESLNEQDDRQLFDYISEIQRDAYHAGFAAGVKLMEECNLERSKLKPRQ